MRDVFLPSFKAACDFGGYKRHEKCESSICSILEAVVETGLALIVQICTPYKMKTAVILLTIVALVSVTLARPGKSPNFYMWWSLTIGFKL